MASTSSVVMSATMISTRAPPASATATGSLAGIFLVDLGRCIHRAAVSDSIKMRGEELPRCLAPVRLQSLKEFELVVEATRRIGRRLGAVIHGDTVEPQR